MTAPSPTPSSLPGARSNPFPRYALIAGLATWAVGGTGILLTRNGVIGTTGLGVTTVITFAAAVSGLILGLLGVTRDRRRQMGEAGVSMLGVILSAVGLFVSAMSVGAIPQGRSLTQAEPATNSSAQFVMLLGSGNIQAAKGLCVPEMDETRLTDAFEKVQSWRALRNIDKHYGGEVRTADDIEVWTLMRFESTAKVLKGQWVRIDGVLRLKSFDFEDAPPAATQQAS